MEDRYYIIANLIARDLKGKLSRSEKKVLDAWIAETAENNLLYKQLTNKQNLIEQLKAYNQLSQQDYRAESEQIMKALDLPPTVEMHSTVEKRVPFLKRPWVRYSFAVLILISCAFFYFLNRPVKHTKQSIVYTKPSDIVEVLPNKDEAIITLADGSKISLQSGNDTFSTDQGNFKVSKIKNSLKYELTDKQETSNKPLYNVIATPRGGWLHVELPDGSKAILNSASSITFSVSSSPFKRQVIMTGEVYFEIAQKNPKESFFITALALAKREASAEVKATGTRFVISAYTDVKHKTVTLLDGEITVLSETANILKTPTHIKKLKSGGQQAQIFNNGQISIKEVDTLVCSSWKNGYLCFKQTPTYEVIRQLKNWYNIDSDYDPDKNSECFHSGNVDRNTSIYGIMQAMEQDCQTLHFNFNETNKMIEVSSK